MGAPHRADPQRPAASRRTSVGLLLVAITLIVTVPGQAADGAASQSGASPTWRRVVQLQDGRRTLVTDGALALDAALAKPPVPPSDLGPSPGGILERHLSADLPDEFRLAQLEPGQRPQTYVAPSGVVLSARYVDYLRRTLPERNLRLRMKGELDPVVLVLDGRPVGLLMPMRP